MAFTFENLDATTREYMLQELDYDLAHEELYLSKRLSEEGTHAYPSLLREAIASHDETWLAEQLKPLLRASEQKRTPSGGTTTARVPQAAHTTLAEGEFNRFYMRGVSARALAEGIQYVEVYRGKSSGRPRPESEARIGLLIPAQTLLVDLRNKVGTDTALGVPKGPNSGLTVRLARHVQQIEG